MAMDNPSMCVDDYPIKTPRILSSWISQPCLMTLEGNPNCWFYIPLYSHYIPNKSPFVKFKGNHVMGTASHLGRAELVVSPWIQA